MNPTKTTAEVYGNYVGNKWTTASSAATFDDENPASKGSVLACFQSAAPRDITAAIDVAAEAYTSARYGTLRHPSQIAAQ